MPREHTSRREVLNAIQTLPSIRDLLAVHDGHFEHELDLEVSVYGRNYNGKKVGPYVRLLTYEPGEPIISAGDWGGNTFYIVVNSHADVFINAPNGQTLKVSELAPGQQFGEMSVLAGVPRNATVRAAAERPTQIMEVQRPALRLLRKIKSFAEALDSTYRRHGRDNILDALRTRLNLTPEQTQELKNMSLFRVFSKNHILFREGTAVDRLYVIQSGWLRRVHYPGGLKVEDYLGRGFAFGVDGILKNSAWPWTVTLMGRTEVLEISITKLRQNTVLREALARGLGELAPPETQARVSAKVGVRGKTLAAQQALIDTGLVDGTNLLVMDMDLCVRCGNCSLACHKIHGQSRLLRRGIQVTRLEAPRLGATQSILSPSVCMHCKDPECLTGCPTGAIGRFGNGQIDINKTTCIGCGDCATQCPYNAISMIPRRDKAAEQKVTFATKLQDYLRVGTDPLPPAIEATDDLVAVKCNLCNNTSMNPEGSKRQAYSCEENCPTGALARVSPIQYFDEIGAIQGLLVLDRTHAMGRNIHRSDPPRRLSHIIGIALTVLLTAGTIYGLSKYGLGERLVSFLNMRWITGLVGLVGIIGVMLYPMRRKVYTKRKGPLRYWLLSHLYLGVIGGIMILLHGGKDAGGLLTAALMISFDLVILTGLFGILAYQVAPRILTQIEGSPLLIDDLLQRRDELQKELAELGATPAEPLRNLVRNRIIPRFTSFGFLLRQYLKREPLDVMIDAAKHESSAETQQLQTPKERERLAQAIEAAVTMRRVDALIYLHRMCKWWLPPHVATTSLMLALMIIHIIQVIYYASR
ncbi:MAG TPA: cyclic nucleotide-binding domain-containing protein [Blastocatellia bacterium]|nr:cyclic nucleotide-binding domain-containing protein [Blastocatellia bacterium]